MDDLKCFFYCLKQAGGSDAGNVVGRRIAGKDLVCSLPSAGYSASKHYRFCLRVQGMGDLNACSIAQCTHEAILRSGGCLAAHEHLKYGLTVPPGPVWDAVFIDDRVVVRKLDISDVNTKHSGRDVELMKNGEEVYASVEGLTRATEKEVRFEETFVQFCNDSVIK